MTAKALVLPTEDAQAYHDRVTDILRSLGPRNGVERTYALQAANASWLHDRAICAQTARLAALVRDEPRRRFQEVQELGRRLFWNRRGPIQIYACNDFHHMGSRASYADDPEDGFEPALLVNELESTVEGCDWMLAQWAMLRSLLVPGSCWLPAHKLMAIRLLGKQPLDAIHDREVAQLHLHTWFVQPIRATAWTDQKSEVGSVEYKWYRKSMLRQWPKLFGFWNKEKDRGVLIEIVDRAIERVQAKAALAAEHAEEDAALRADCLLFDDSHTGALLRGYELSHHRKFARSVNDFLKVRRAADNGEIQPELESEEDGHPAHQEGDGHLDRQAL